MYTPTQIMQMETVVSVCNQRKLRALLRSYGYSVPKEVTLSMVQSAIAEYGDDFRVEFAKLIKTGIKRYYRMNYIDGDWSADNTVDTIKTGSELLGILLTTFDFGGVGKANANAQIAASNAVGANANAQIAANIERTKQILWGLAIVAIVIVVLVVLLRKKK